MTSVQVEETRHRPFGKPMRRLLVEGLRGHVELFATPEEAEVLAGQIRWQAHGDVRRSARPVRPERGSGRAARGQDAVRGPRTIVADLALALAPLRRGLVRGLRVAMVVALNAVVLFGGIMALMGATPGDAASGTGFGVGGSGVYTSGVTHLIEAAAASDTTPLAPASATPPAPPPANGPPLPSHQVFGFAPYWTLGQSGGFDVSGLTTVAYFSVDVNANGTLDEGGAGWGGLQSQAFADLRDRAHRAGDRVVLTVTCFEQGTLDQVTSDPAAPANLAGALVPLLRAKALDGVNLDFEGTGPRDQAGLTHLVAGVSGALRSADPSWQITMDTYASSASSNGGFYDIGALAPSVDAFFVMSYSLNLAAPPSADSALTSQMFSDQTAVREYLAVVPPSKVILGLPYFGYDWPTNGNGPNAAAVGGATTVAAGQIEARGGPLYWDATTDTAWTSYQVGSQWHESFFDDATSLYMAAQLAASNQLAGDGIWALGMDGNDPSMLAAVDGHAPAVKDLPTGPAPSPAAAPTTTTVTLPPSGVPAPASTGGPSPSPAPATTTTLPNPLSVPTTGAGPSPTTSTTTPVSYSYGGSFNGTSVHLTALGWPGLTNATDPQLLGQLTGFATTDPAYACLIAASGLEVEAFGNHPGLDVVVATQPTDCVNAEFFFPSSVLNAG
jgi:hypothetical protein